MFPGPLGHEVGVVGGGWVGDSPGTPAVEVTEVVGQHLQLVSRELTVVPEDLVVAGPAGPLDPLVTQEVEVSLQRVNRNVDPSPASLTSVGWLIPWSTTVPARTFPLRYLLLSAGKNLNKKKYISASSE